MKQYLEAAVIRTNSIGRWYFIIHLPTTPAMDSHIFLLYFVFFLISAMELMRMALSSLTHCWRKGFVLHGLYVHKCERVCVFVNFPPKGSWHRFLRYRGLYYVKYVHTDTHIDTRRWWSITVLYIQVLCTTTNSKVPWWNTICNMEAAYIFSCVTAVFYLFLHSPTLHPPHWGILKSQFCRDGWYISTGNDYIYTTQSY